MEPSPPSARATITCVGSKPRSNATNAAKLRRNNPAAVNSVRASATCATASPVWPVLARNRPTLLPAGAPASFSMRTAPARDPPSAGAAPNKSPATTDRPTANAATTPSTRTSASPGTSRGTSVGAACTIPAATARPRAPPTALSTTLSVSNWPTMRPRPAPSARRTANSRRRAFPRTSSSPATFAHASSKTSPVAVVNIRSAGRNGAPTSSCNGVTRASRFALHVAGSAGPARSRIARTSASACRGDTPRRRRPIARNPLASTAPPGSGASSGRTTNGVQRSDVPNPNSNPAESTPATACGSPSSSTTSPTTSGSDANRFVHTSWLSSATRGAPSTASKFAKSRPSCGSARSTAKNEGDTCAPTKLVGPRAPSTTKARGAHAASCSNDRASSRSRSRWPLDSREDAPGKSVGTCPTVTISADSGYGSGRRSSPRARLKAARFRPMPIERMASAARVKNGRTTSCRTA